MDNYLSLHCSIKKCFNKHVTVEFLLQAFGLSEQDTQNTHNNQKFSFFSSKDDDTILWNASLHEMGKSCKAKQQQKKKLKQVKALTVQQARQSFHQGSIFEDGLVEYDGHV